ncbi:MAG: SDR family oxidoreductase, partial [Gemmatimonadales bacterium]
ASKHAVKGFTDSLRMEVHEAGAPVSVTLIQPAAINTPYPQHAKNYLEVEPKHMPPVYAPEVVADAILRCAEHPARDVLVGGGAMVLSATERYAPHLGDLFKEATAFSGQRSDQPARDDDTLHAPRPGDASVRGTYSGHVIESSAYTRARLNPGKTLFGIAVVAAGLAVAGRSARQGKGRGD